LPTADASIGLSGTTEWKASMTSRFHGKTAIVTGAASGIGREICLAFAEEGMEVFAVDFLEAGAAETAALVVRQGGQAHAIRADISVPNDVSSMFATALAKVGRIDCAVNNAGVNQVVGKTAEIEPAEWDRVLRVNLTGTWLCMREQLAHMAARRAGAIVNIASVAALRTLPHHSAYVASKTAVAALTKNAAVEYADAGIRINAVCPGSVPTGMFEKHLAALGEAARETELLAAARRHPIGRVGTTRDIADAVLFLCSDQASFITGDCLAVDGGRSVA
jgi:NAD(P)-dependent dehydrogenase (short-subunit alcohol dehydrogenase family)